MANNSKISWTNCTWNVITGCKKVTEGCKNCYAEKMTKRLLRIGIEKYSNGFTPTFHEDILGYPLTIKKPKMIFVNSMSDTFNENISDENILKIFDVMNRAYWHTFQVLTKRAHNILKLSNKINWTDNIWLGVTIEKEDYFCRLDYLKNSEAKIKFISFEPLLSDVSKVDLSYIDWVIVGGETGSNSRTVKKEWVYNIKNVCEIKNIPFFFKQWGSGNKSNLIEGIRYNQYPIKKEKN